MQKVRRGGRGAAPARRRPLATPEFALAQSIAAWLAASVITPKHLLAGVYIAAWDRLCRLWRDPNAFEELVAQECELPLPRWTYWLEFGKRQRPSGWLIGLSGEASGVLDAAAALARQRAQRGGPEELRCEDFLFALASNTRLPLGRLVRACGVDMRRLSAARPQRTRHG